MRVGSVLACLAALLAGCVAMRPFPAPNLPVNARLVEVRDEDGEPSAIQPVSHRAKNALVLSGGGMNGAFTAGVLNGWTESGKRPTFDVVTGISTGALIAPFALLGPDFDDALQRSYTTLRDNDIFKRRYLLALPWAESIADSSPLRHRIETEVTPELLERIAQAYREGRRLYIGTTDLDAKKLIAWDIGAIASGDDPNKLELVRKVILASASVPGFLPPVPINVKINGQPYTELHVDGGVTASLFLRPSMLGIRKVREAELTDTNIHVIVAGKLRPERESVKRNLLGIGGESLETVLQAAQEGDIIRVFMLARLTGARFAVTGIPDDFGGASNALKFNPEVMRQLYETGRRVGQTGEGWLATPPTIGSGDNRPRGGVEFDAVERKSATVPATK